MLVYFYWFNLLILEKVCGSYSEEDNLTIILIIVMILALNIL